MKKRILALALSALLSIGFIMTVSAEEPLSSEVTAVDGNVSITATVNAPEGTPVMIFILPYIIENGVDVTAEKVESITTAEILASLNVEHASVVKADENSVVHYNCQMKDSLPTGICHVVLGYLGSDDCYSAGTFEHVGNDDVKALVNKFNTSAASGYAAIINEDMYGTSESVAKEILRKSSADTAYYAALSDEDEEEFCGVLYTLKGNESFTIGTLVSDFNEASVWMRLRTESDTLSVLNVYNGEGSGKYWNLPLGDDSDFSTLPESEQTKILSSIKDGGYIDSTELADDFKSGIAMALIRTVDTREDLDALISSESAYADEFVSVREIVKNAKLDEYYLAKLYNNVISGVAECETIDDLEDLFNTSVPMQNVSGASPSGKPMGGGGSTGGGGGVIFIDSSGKTDEGQEVRPTPEPETSGNIPFTDVSESHWASDYIERLYETGVINGVNETEFAPSNSVQRQDFVKILIGALEMELLKVNSVFTDVPNDAYFKPYIMTAYENKLISGISEDIFGVGANIKREDAAVIMDRVLILYGAYEEGNVVVFADSNTVAEYAKDAVARVASAGIFGGDDEGNFNPKDDLSRAEACAVLCRLADLIKEG